MCTSPEGTSMHHACVRRMEKNVYSAPFIPCYNNNTKNGICMLDLSQNVEGGSAVENVLILNQ